MQKEKDSLRKNQR